MKYFCQTIGLALGNNEPFIGLIPTLDSEIRALSSAQPSMNDVDPSSVFASIREQENITEALRAAQPLVDDKTADTCSPNGPSLRSPFSSRFARI